MNDLIAYSAIVDRFDVPAILLGRDYRILAANGLYTDRYGAAVRVGESTCFAVSHGYDSPCDQNNETCPLQHCVATRERTRVLHVHHGPRGPEYVDVEMIPIPDDTGEPRWFVELIQPVDSASVRPQSDAMVGVSHAFRQMVAEARRAAPGRIPVLLQGQSGTGKERLARFIHAESEQRHGPLVTIECAGLTETLFEAELFGHERGAFTGAHQRRDGLVAAANGGTLFLDELGDVPLGLQVKLLRLVETGTYRRVGSVETRRSDFRLISATHRDLPAMVHSGAFREDLYYRLSAFPIHLPSLRERTADIELLSTHLLGTINPSLRLSGPALERLRQHHWPGNIRELKNVLERAALTSPGGLIRDDHLLLSGAPRTQDCATPLPDDDAFQLTQVIPLADLETRYLRWVESRGQRDGLRRPELARQLGVSERTLFRKLARDQ